MDDFFNKSIEETIKHLDTDEKHGLINNKVEENLKKYGENKLETSKKKSIIKLIFEQLKDFLIIILLIASLIYMTFGKEYLEGTIIILIVIINIIIGVFQENKANNALEALKEMTNPQVKVKRNNIVEKINSNLLVVGDIVILESGDYVPADIRLIETINMKVDESTLTGESLPVEKNANTILKEDTILAERVNFAYMGTIVTYGRGVGVVCKTGMNTEIGKIANILKETKEEKTPLQVNLDSLGKSLGISCIVICILVFLLGLFYKMKVLEIFMLAISLAVASIPEGLAIVVTIVLAIGVQKMVKSNVIIKKLSAVETLGSTNVICSDKTGTLTQNKMTVVRLYDFNKEYEITGTGYSTEGKIINNTGENITKNVELILEGSVLCNDSLYNKDKKEVIGDPTEVALIILGEKLGIKQKETKELYKRIDEIPFDSKRKLMTTYNKKNGKIIMYTKGAPDELLKICTKIYEDGEIVNLTEEYKNKILKENEKFTEKALRVLGIAFRNFENEALIDKKEEELIFLGLIGMIDPPREEVKEAVEKCKKAGITVKMITGDHKITAKTIAKELSIINENEEVLDGETIEKLSEEELKEKVKTINIFARVSPEHKVRLVDAIKSNKNIVAMTGDGVNDAASLKKADIGIAMGITGTDVSKEASDMILIDDNFVSIVKAIEEGRTIYNNIIKVVSYFLSGNIAEVLIILIAMLFSFPVPLSAIQLLFINLFTDAFPAFCLGTEKKEDNIMEKKPRDSKKRILDKDMWISIIFRSGFLAITTLGSFFISMKLYDENIAKTVCFSTLVISELLISYIMRRDTYKSLKDELIGNKYLNQSVIISLIVLLCILFIPFFNNIFHISPINLQQLSISLIFSIISFIGIELFKIFYKKNSPIN